MARTRYGTQKQVSVADADSKKIAAEDKSMARLGILAGTYQKTDRILSGRGDIEVRIVRNGQSGAPSWTDGKIIFLNADLLPLLKDTAALVAVTGLNYHELAHVLFSPRVGEEYTRSLMRESLFGTANLLEDQRIETAFTGLYPPAKAYFTEVVSRYIATAKQYDGAFVLTHGRRYLPVGVRSMLRQRYKHQIHVPLLRALIDEYRVLVYPRDSARMLDITREVHKILVSTQTQIDNPHGDCAGHVNEGRADENKGESGSRAAQEDSVDDEDTGDDDSASGDGGGEGEQDDDADSSGESEGGGDQGAGGDAEGDATDGAGSGESETAEGGGGGGTGSGEIPEDRKTGERESGSDEPPTDDEIRDAAQSAADDAAEDEEVQSEVDALKSTMNQQQNEESIAAGDEYTTVDITPEVSQTYQTVSRELQRIFSQYESGWERGVESGRLSVANVMASVARDGFVDQETAFDRWAPDQRDEIGLEVVLLLDQSGSMSSNYASMYTPSGRFRGAEAVRRAVTPIAMASDALYTMKRALDDVDANTTVIGFGSFAGTLYKRGESAPKGNMRRFDANKGGTSPWDALRVANSILSGSDRPNKVLAVFTDGGWNAFQNHAENVPVEAQDALIKSMPWTTGLFGIGSDVVSTYGDHGCKVTGNVEDYASFVKVLRDLVTEILKTA